MAERSEINSVEFAIVNRVVNRDVCTRVSSIITLIVVAPIIRGVCLCTRDVRIVSGVHSITIVRVSRSSDPMRAGSVPLMEEQTGILFLDCFRLAGL